MFRDVTQTFAAAISWENLIKNGSFNRDLAHLEQSVQVAISRYFLIFNINGFILYENFGIVGFSKERPKFNIQLKSIP